MSDEERYRLTHELYMLWQMRYKVGGPLVMWDTPEEKLNRAVIVEREKELARRLGFVHECDFRPKGAVW